MTPPHFLDSGVRFTAMIPQHALLDAADLAWVATLPRTGGLSDAQRHALVALRHGEQWTNRTFRERFPMDSTQARAALVDLVARGLAVAHGERGGRVYRLAAAVGSPPGTTRHAEVIIASLQSGPASTVGLMERTGLSRRQVTYALKHLSESGQIRVDGGQGVLGTTYSLTGGRRQQ